MQICAKIRYETRVEAMRMIHKLPKDRFKKVWVYPCKSCGGFHRTSRNPKKKYKFKTRATEIFLDIIEETKNENRII